MTQATTVSLPDYSQMKLFEIADQVRKEWKKVSPYAEPYLEAMGSLGEITDNFYADSGSSVVAYFLANAQSFKGEAAKTIKKELNKRLKNK
jgi:hypothetical protein